MQSLRKLTRRYLLRTVTGGSVLLTAGCETQSAETPSTATERTPLTASEQDSNTETSKNQPIYSIEIAPIVGSTNNAFFRMSVMKNNIDPTDYRTIGPIELITPPHIGVRQIIPISSEQELVQSGVELALGVGTEVLGGFAPFPIPDPGLAIDIQEVIASIKEQEGKLPNHLTVRPENPLHGVQYLVWLTSKQPVTQWGYPSTTQVVYQYKESDDATSTLKTAGPLLWQFPACGRGTNKATPTPTSKTHQPAWWDTDWQFRRPVSINERSDNNLTDYPLTFTVRHNGKANSDCSDIRLVADGESIPYAIRNCDRNSVNVAVRQDIGGLQTKQLFVYYGNPKASDESREWNQLAWDFYEDFEQYSPETILTGRDGWIKKKSNNPDLKVEQSAYAENRLALGSTSHSHGTQGFNTRMRSWQYPDMGFMFQAIVNVETRHSLPRVGISTWTEGTEDKTGASIHFDSSNDGAGDDDTIDFFFFGNRAVLEGKPTRSAYEAEIIGYPDQTGVGRYRERGGSWQGAQLSTSFNGQLNSVKFNLWKWGGQVDSYVVRRFVDPEPNINVGAETRL